MRLRRAVYVGVLAAWLAATAAATAADRVWVLSQGGAALTELDLDAGKAGATIALDKAPAAFVLSPDARLAYVTHPDLSKVSVVDLAKRRVTRSFDVPGSPFGIAVTRSGVVYVGNWNGADVAVFDQAGRQAATVAVGQAPAHLLLSGDGTRLYVANRESDSISIVRTADTTVEATVAVGRAPFAMALAPDGKQLYAGNVQAGTVTVIDTEERAVVAEYESGAMPYGAAVTPDGTTVLITNQQAGTLAALEHGGRAETVKVGGYPEGVAIIADGKRAYVANWFSDDVSEIDVAAMKLLRSIEVPGGPRGIIAVP